MATSTGEASGAKDGKAFYGYLYEKPNRKGELPCPTPTLDALLRAIALYIKLEIGDKLEPYLTPAKMAAYYKAIGHNYDSLFIEMPSQSIQYIYQIQACRYILVQGSDDTEVPSIPALTRKGFVRFESIQILLDPGTHVPLIQFAVRNWNLKHPDNGTPFPADLPKECFPTETDEATDIWHQDCGRRLREQATPREDPKPKSTDPSEPPKPGFSDRKVPFAHVRIKRPSQEDYFNRPNVPFSHVPEHAVPRGTPLSRSPERERYRDRERDRGHADRLREEYLPRRQGSSSDEPGHRRKSFDHNHIPQETRSAHVPHRTAERHPAPRRHSQPRHYSSSSETEESPVSPRTQTRRRSHRSTDPPAIRRVYPNDGPRVVTSHPHLASVPGIPIVVSEEGRRASRSDDQKRKSLFDIKGKVLSFFPVGGDPVRQRSGSRGRRNEAGGHGRSSAHKEDGHPPSRLGRSYSDYSDESESGSPHRKRPSKPDLDRERDRERARERELRDRAREKVIDRDRDREKSSRGGDRRRSSDERRERERDRDRRERDRAIPHRRSREPSDEEPPPRSRPRGSGGMNSYLSHPEDGFRRTSSHADLDRKRDWDARDRDLRARDDRIRDRVERERHRDKERERSDGVPTTRLPSPPTGVSGRKYADPWN